MRACDLGNGVGVVRAVGEQAEVLRFNTRSGELRVSRGADGLLAMDFPAKQPVAVDIPQALLEALGLTSARALYRTDDYVLVIDDAELLGTLTPDFVALSAFDVRGIAVTAPGGGFDFVTRWFGPRVGVNEDPVTGSAHTSLAPYWSERLGKRRLVCEQGGARKGQLECEVPGNGRVIISGRGLCTCVGSSLSEWVVGEPLSLFAGKSGRRIGRNKHQNN